MSEASIFGAIVTIACVLFVFAMLTLEMRRPRR